MSNRLIGTMIFLVIGLALLPVIAGFVDDLAGTGGQFENTGTGTLINLIPVLYVIGLVTGSVASLAIAKK